MNSGAGAKQWNRLLPASMPIPKIVISLPQKSACTPHGSPRPWGPAEKALRRCYSRYFTAPQGFGSGNPHCQLGVGAIDSCDS